MSEVPQSAQKWGMGKEEGLAGVAAQKQRVFVSLPLSPGSPAESKPQKFQYKSETKNILKKKKKHRAESQ